MFEIILTAYILEEHKHSEVSAAGAFSLQSHPEIRDNV